MASAAAAVEKRCAECSADVAPSLCSGCKAVHYCGAACQKKHWPAHKAACKQQRARRGGAGKAGDGVVCGPHSLEVCGACGVDFRGMNKLSGRQAKEPARPRLKQRDLGINTAFASLTVDPRRLPAFDLGAPAQTQGLATTTGGGNLQSAFNATFTFNEKMAPEGEKPTDAQYLMRENMVLIAKCLDEHRGEIPTASFVVQDKAQSVCLLIKTRAVLQAPEGDAEAAQAAVEAAGGEMDYATAQLHRHGAQVPLVLLAYSAHSVKEMSARLMDKFQRFHKSASGIGVVQLEDTALAVECFVQLLDANRKRLAPAYTAGREPSDVEEKGYHMSFFTPTSKPAFTEALTEETAEAYRRCATCGGGGGDKSAMKRCAGCEIVYYCSPACQKADWPVHKKTCALGTPKDAPKVRIDLAKGRDDAQIISTISMTGRGNMMPQKRPAGAPAHLVGKPAFMVKVQVPMGGGDPDPMLMVYDQTRKLHTMISPSMAVGGGAGVAKLIAMVHRDGPQGLKGYFSAEVPAEGNGRFLDISIDRLLRPPAW